MEMTRPNPTFSVTRLRPATTYLVRVAGVNHRGASRPSQLQVVTSTVLSQPQETSAGTRRGLLSDRNRGVCRFSN